MGLVFALPTVPDNQPNPAQRIAQDVGVGEELWGNCSA
jgi:hypothetical protein